MLKVEDITRERVQGEILKWMKGATLDNMLWGTNRSANQKSLFFVAESLISIIKGLRERVKSFEGLVVEYYSNPNIWIKPILLANQFKYFGKLGCVLDYEIEDTAFLIFAKYLQEKLKTDYQIAWKPKMHEILAIQINFFLLPSFESLIETVDFQISGSKELDRFFLRATTEAVRSSGEYGGAYFGGLLISEYIAELCLALAKAVKDVKIVHPIQDIKWKILNILADHEDDRTTHEPEYSRLYKVHDIINGSVEEYVLARA